MNSNNIPAYTAIHYNTAKNVLFIWYADGSKKAFKVKHRFYTPNRGEFNSMPCGMKDVFGREVFEVITSDNEERQIYKQVKGVNNYLYEIDIDFRIRWLNEHYKNTDNIIFNINDYNIGFIDIEVETGDRFPLAKRADRPINCVTLYVSKLNKFFTFGLKKDIKPETKKKFIENDMDVEYVVCETEVKLLERLFKKIGESELDFLLAWNGDNFDYPYIINRSEKLNVDIRDMSRLPKMFKEAYMSDNGLKIAGTTVIDHLKLYKKFTLNDLDSYKLDDVGYSVTKKRKAELPDGYHSYKNYWDDYVFYNVFDVKLAVEIEKYKKMIDVTIAACLEARVPFDKIFSSKDVIVGFILNYLHKNGMVFPPLKANSTGTFPGAYVFSSPNFHEHVVSYDYRSMYPSIILGANISIETKVEYPIDYVLSEEEKKNLVRSPWTSNNKKQIYYRKDVVGIIPSVTKILFSGRDEFKKLMKKAKIENNKEMYDFYNMKQNTYKRYANSLYGLLGYPKFHFYDMDNSATITSFGVNLIKDTIEEYSSWLEKDLENNDKFISAFGEKPNLNHEKYDGDIINDDGEKQKKRLSHGDTDSFFVKYDDIYSPFIKLKGKFVDVLVIEDTDVVYRKRHDIQIDNTSAKMDFENKIKEYCGLDLNSLDAEEKEKIIVDGMFSKGNVKVFYNSFSLTDFSRVFDSILVEKKLNSIMENFSKKYNFLENTLFIKREKCISSLIVTAKKKYICLVESNEDIKYKNEELVIVGLEIVKSSSTPFTKKYILDLIVDILKTKDKQKIIDKYYFVKSDFYETIKNKNLYQISIPSGVGADPPKFEEIVDKKNIDWRLLSSSVWNYLIENDKILSSMILEPIYENSKVKFINVFPNKFNVTKIAYVGNNPPERLFEIFEPDWKSQWDVIFGNMFFRVIEAIGWDTNFEKDRRKVILKYF